MKKRTRLLLILVAALCLCLGFGVFAACKNEPKKHVHEYTAWAHDGTYHWKECPVDDVADESTREEHTMVDGKCTVCDYQEAPPAHTHAYTQLQADATNHWYECPDDGDYIAQFGHIYGEDGKCIVCEKEGTAPEEFELDERKWYIVGNGAGSLLGVTWDHLGAALTRSETPDANGYTVYTTFEVTLYAGDQFKLVQDLDWDDGLGYYSFSDLANTSGVFRDAGGGNITPQAGHDGIYQFIIRSKPDLGPTSVMVEWKLVEALEPLDVEEQFDMYIIGKMKATGYNQWITTPDQMVKMNLMADGETFYTVVELASNDEFKVYNLKSNGYFPDGTGNNLKVPTTTLYVVTWKVGDRAPVIEEYHHIHNYGEYLRDANEHWRVCVQDGEMDEKYGKVAHEFGDDNFCDVCGYEKADKPECETHTWGTDNVCTVCGRHWVYTEGLAYQINAKRDAYNVVGLHEDTDPATVKDIVVPYYFNGKPVVGIAENAFYNGSTKFNSIKKVVLPDTVKKIGTNAFRQLTNLTSLKLGAGVEEIGANAFRDSVYIATVNLPEGLKKIGVYAFSRVRITELALPSTLTELGGHAFEGTYLVDIAFADGIGLKTIGENVFASTYLKEIVLPEGLEEIGTSAFSGATMLAQANIPASVKSIGAGAFASTALTSVTFEAPGYWKYATSASSEDWIVLAPATTEDPAAAAAWIKEKASNCLALMEAHEHNFILSSNATQHWYRCAVCDALKEAKQAHKIFDQHCSVCGIEHTEHTYSTAWTTDGTNHWHACTICGAEQPGTKVKHTWNSTNTMCTACYYTHTHTYAEDWTYDETNHWHASTCGHTSSKSGSAAHAFGEDNICPTCGYERIVQGENNGTPGLLFDFNSEYTGLIVRGFKEVPEDATEIIIPAKCGNWPVVEVARYAFNNSKLATVKKVVIPDTVKIIRNSAFRNLKMTDLTMSANVYKIEDRAFEYCTALTAVTLPETLKTLPQYVFCNCTALAKINLENITDIGAYAFQNCSSLDNVKLSKDLTVVRGYTFDGCTSLNTIDFGGMKEIGDTYSVGSAMLPQGYAFRNCGFTTLTLPEGITTIRQYAFQNCTKLTKVVFPKECTWGNSEGSNMFEGCTSLADVNFENVVVTGGAMFANCGFVDLTIPASCSIKGSGAFRGCTKLRTLTVKSTTVAGNPFWQCPALETATVSKVVNSMFESCTSLHTVIMTDEVETIGQYAFRYCEKLTSVTFSTKLTEIGNQAFLNCKLLDNVTLPASLTKIASSFNGCASLSRIEIPEKTEVTGSAFSGCTNLSYVKLPNTLTSIGSSMFKNCTSLATITIPASVTSIGSSAFSGCTLLNNVTLPAGLTSLGGQAFKGCTALTAITIPDKVATISYESFSGCTNLATVKIGAGVTKIEYRVFQNCTSLKEITIPASVTKIGITAFQDSGLTSATFANKTGWNVKLSGAQTPVDFSGDSATVAQQLTSKAFGTSQSNYYEWTAPEE